MSLYRRTAGKYEFYIGSQLGSMSFYRLTAGKYEFI
jgi:hypothetical protein